MKLLLKYTIVVFVFIFMFFVLAQDSHAATCNSSQSGNWTSQSTWGGITGGCGASGPIAGDTVTINSGHTVTMDGNSGACATLTISGTANWTMAYTTAVSGALNLNGGTISGSATGVLTTGSILVNASTTNSIQRVTLTNSGITTVDGTINFQTSATGTKTFVGTVTIRSGGVWSDSIGTAEVFRGGISHSGTTFSTGTGTTTFNTNSQALSGSSDMTFGAAVTLSNSITLTNNNTGTVTITGNATGNFCTFATGASSYTKFGAGVTMTTLTPSGSANTVEYSGGAQTVKAPSTNNYYHLILSGSGAKTLTSIRGTSGNLTLSGTATASVAANFTVAGNLNVGSGTQLTFGAYTTAVTGTSTITGTLVISSTTGTKTFTGAVTIASGGTWNNSGNEAVTFQGGLTNNSSQSHTIGTGIYTFDTNDQTIDGTYSLDIPSLTVNVDYVHNNLSGSASLTVSTDLAGSGTLVQKSSSILILTGTVTITSLDASTNSNTVKYTKAGDQTVKAVSYSTLELGTSGAKTMTSVTTIGALTISGSATMTGNAALTVSGAFTYNSSGSTTLTSSTNISIGTMNQSDGTINDNGNTITVTGSSTPWTKSGGTFTTSGTVIFNANATIATLLSGTVNFNNLTFSPTLTSSRSYTFGVVPTIAGNFTINPSGAYTLTAYLSGNSTITGSISLTGASSGTSVLDTSSSNNYSLNCGSMSISSGSSLLINASTLTISGTSNTLFTNSGTFTAGTNSTVVFDGDGAPTALLSGSFTSSNSFYNLNLTPTITADRSWTMGAAFSTNGNFTIQPSASSTYRLTTTLGGTTTIASTKTTTISGTSSGVSTLNTGSNYALSTGLLSISTAGTLTANASTITITASSGTILSQSGTITSGSHTFAISGSGTLSFIAATTFNNITITGTATVSTDFSVGGTLTVSGSGNLSPSGGTITMTGGSIANSATLVFNNLTFTGTTTSSSSFSVAGTLNVNGGNFSPDSGTITMTGGTITNSGTLSFAGLTFSGTTTSSSSFSVKGNWTNNGTLNQSAGTVTFNGSGSQTITGSNNNFYGLAITASSARTVTINGGTVLSVASNGSLTLQGTDSSNKVTLQSDGGTDWHLHVSTTNTTVSVSYVAVSHSDASGYKQIDASNGTNYDGGNNTNWLWPSANCQWVGGTSIAWETGGNWTGCAGSGGVPATTDSVVIVTGSSYNPTLTSSVTIAGLTLTSGTLTMSTNSSFTINGNVTLNGGTFNAASYNIGLTGNWTNNGGTFTSGTSLVEFNGASSQAINGSAASQTFNDIHLIMSIGQTLSVSGSTTTLNVNNITETEENIFSAPANLNILGDWQTCTGCGFTHNSGTVTFNNTSNGQSIVGGSAEDEINFSTLVINKSSQTLTSDINLNIATAFTITSGIFNIGSGNVINSAGAAGTISGSGTIKVTGSDYDDQYKFTTNTLTSLTLDYAGSTQTVNGSYGNLGNLVISASGTKTLDATTGIVENLTISAGTLDLSSYSLNRTSSGGTLTVANGSTLKIGGTGTIPSNYSTHSIGSTSTIDYSGSTQSVGVLNSSQHYGHLVVSASGTKTLAGTITVDGNLTIYTGILDDNGYQITGNGSNILSVYTGATLSLGANTTATSFPTNFTNGNISLDVSSTVIYKAAATTTISTTPTYGNLTLSPTISGDISYSFATATTTINGNLVINPTSSGANRLTVTLGGATTIASNKTTTISGTTSALSTLDTGSNLVFTTGALTIDAAGTFNANNSNPITINKSSGTILSQSGTFNAGGSTVVISGSGVISLPAATTLNNLTITGTPTTSSNVTINGALSVSGSGNFSPSGGTVTMATTGWSIANSATLLFSGLTISETPSSQSNTSFNISGALTVDSGKTFAPSGGTITMNNGGSIVNNGGATSNLVFQGLTINSDATVTTGSSFSIAGALTNSSSATFEPSGGTITMSTTGSSISNAGSSLIFNGLTIAATPTSQTQYNTSYAIGGTLTVNNSITFAPSGGTITLTGTSWGLASTGTITFYNMTISGTPSSQPTRDFSIAGALTVDSGKTLAPTSGTITMTGGSIVNNGGATSNLVFQGLTYSSTTTSSSSFSVKGNWTNNGTFNQSAGTVTFNGSGTQTITGSNNNFFGLSMTASSARTITITAGSVLSIAANGSLNLQGTDVSNRLTLQSDGSDWHLHVSNSGTSQDVSYVAASHSDASGYDQINASDGTNYDGGNNTNWNFGETPTPTPTSGPTPTGSAAFNFGGGFDMQGINID